VIRNDIERIFPSCGSSPRDGGRVPKGVSPGPRKGCCDGGKTLGLERVGSSRSGIDWCRELANQVEEIPSLHDERFPFHEVALDSVREPIRNGKEIGIGMSELSPRPLLPPHREAAVLGLRATPTPYASRQSVAGSDEGTSPRPRTVTQAATVNGIFAILL
jgi:hypothetical protein